MKILELVTMVIASLEGERACKLRPYDRARCTLVHLRKHNTLEQIAAGFGIGVATAWRYVNDTIERLARFAPSLPRVAHRPSRRRLRAPGRNGRRDRPTERRGPFLWQGSP
ncbi:transposase family protein [Streptomyces chartreusis]|uniref:helix-turn-helix domain-containing protein n=1 Tax=Streptomyces chartreusis TaxID=1969 RepID=UPI002E18F2FC